MDFRTWKKTTDKNDTSFITAWREDQGLDRLSDTENEERFDAYLWLVRELDMIALRKMRDEEAEELGLSGSLHFERERYGESVDLDDISLDVDDEADVEGLSDEDVPF